MIKRINIGSYQSWLWHVIDYIALKFFQKSRKIKFIILIMNDV